MTADLPGMRRGTFRCRCGRHVKHFQKQVEAGLKRIINQRRLMSPCVRCYNKPNTKAGETKRLERLLSLGIRQTFASWFHILEQIGWHGGGEFGLSSKGVFTGRGVPVRWNLIEGT